MIKQLHFLQPMFNKKVAISFLIVTILFATNFVQAQSYFKDALQENRTKFYNKIVAGINKTLELPLDSTNEDRWNSAFYNIGFIHYKTPFVNSKIDAAAKIIQAQSTDCKKAFLNFIYSEYPKKYVAQIKTIFKTADDFKLMAMAANYLLPTASAADVKMMLQEAEAAQKQQPDNAILFELIYQLKNWNKKTIVPSIKNFFAKDYLPGQVLVFSFHRKDRNYTGLALVRDTNGAFVKNADGKYFAVGQIARSVSNMPGYITNGNTPQGFFRMNGFDTSNSFFIGPTTNIQLAMPHEYNPFYIDGKLIDTTWSMDQYKNLLPANFKNYHPLYGTFYAGKAGRSEIIAHGTTVDPSFYKTTIYYPYTPTAGCLATKEIWNNNTGFLQTSDQLLLTQAVQKAGGAKGYLIVIEIDDKKAPVALADLVKYLK